ncbi:hypothetical protein FQN49_000812 [Arthroderma sp. PD_2]|nr:hypothetical protein FQN49_000812 [Arthroderma sp. PD_2]
MENLDTECEPRQATATEIRTLPHVVDSVPFIVWVAVFAGAAERFTFYAVTIPWQNYIQNGHESIANPGALGLGQATATKINSAFYFLSFLTPIPFALVSDAWLGRYKTLIICFFLNFCGCLVLFITSLPSVTRDTVKIAGLVVSMVLLGLGTGGVKATVSPFIGDQYTTMVPQLVVRKNGESVIADRTLTLQYIYNVFYWFTNIGALSEIAATYLEKYVGFWAAYLLPLSSCWVSVPLLMLWGRSLVKLAPQGNVLPQAGKVIMYSARNRFRLDAAKPTFQAEKHRRMSCFVPFYLCLSQISNNLVSQAGQMRLGAIPNDTVQVFNSIGCIILGPVIQKVLYPTLQKYKIAFKPIARMAFSFIAMSIAMGYVAGVQKLIYSRGPCYNRPLACSASAGGSISNDISVWVQVPVYFLLAIAEILGLTTLSEYSYSEAPKDMRSVVQALRQVTSGVGSALAVALAQFAKDPDILYLYTGLAVTMILSAPTFWVAFKGYDKDKSELDGDLHNQQSHN